MVFLINASNLKVSGGLQVADSICNQLYLIEDHTFIVVLSSFLNETKERLERYDNVKTVTYDVKNSFETIVFGRDSYLDNLVKKEQVDAVLTIFGPSRWVPRVPHLCGFARAQLLLTSSPFFRNLTLKEKIRFRIWAWGFRRSSNAFYTENPFISTLLSKLIKNSRVYTVTNYYHQIFDRPELWERSIQLPSFDGITCLSISGHMRHKNFEILPGIVSYLERKYPSFRFRFVLTFDEKEMVVPECQRDHFVFIGKVGIAECPSLYEQADIMFMPSLLECFTATYPEAMRMGVPIVTTDLEFARGLCGEAACYYSAVVAGDAAEAIYTVATNKDYRTCLVANGMEQLKKYDNYEMRARKLINILEELSSSRYNNKIEKR